MSIRRPSFIVVTSLFFILATFVFVGSVRAFNNAYPDLSDTAGAANVYLISQESRYVQQSNANMRMWMPGTTGTLQIPNYHFCDSNSYDYLETEDSYGSFGNIPAGTAVTRYVIDGNTYTGYKYNSGDSRCNDTLSVNVSANGRQNGWNYVNIDINYANPDGAGFSGIANAYRLVGSAGSYIGIRSGSTGYDATQEQVDTTPNYTTYYAAFGTPCNVTTAQSATLTFFDLDNAGGSGAQPAGQDITVALLNTTTNTYVNFAGSVGTVWTPASNDNASQDISFTAQPGDKYRLEIRNVFYNNTIQYSVPYDQIYALACVPPVSASFAPQVAAPANFEKGSSATYTFNHNITNVVEPCNPDELVGVKKGPYAWSAAAAGSVPPEYFGIGGNLSGTFYLYNCQNSYSLGATGAKTAYTSNTFTAGQYSITAADRTTLNGVNSFPRGYGRTTTASGTTTAPDYMLVYEVPYARFYGNDISAAGCVAYPTAALTGAIVSARDNDMAITPPDLNGRTQASAQTATTNYRTAVSNQIVGGAAAEYAAIALDGRPNTLLTGTFQPVAAGNNPPLRLNAFWNTGNRPCPQTLYTTVSDPSTLPGEVDVTVTTGAYDIPASSPGANTYVRATGNTTIAGEPNARGKQTIFVSGSARITSNIISTLTPPFNDTTAPVILIIASGSIAIDPSVTRIDAILIAQGTIFTCGNGAYTAQTQTNVDNNCRNKLAINGALAAANIRFQRSIGTRLLATPSEPSTQGQGNAAAAEVINYPAYLYFATPYLQDKAESTFQSYFTPAPYF
jgi:hypothetical protein